MSDIYMPGLTSRFNSDKLIENLMKVERIPKDRVEKNLEFLRNQKGYWQDVGRRMNTLRESARLLFSYQNPFNDRIIKSQDETALTGTATREAVEQGRNFTIKQVAKADRFLSQPLEESYAVGSGMYTLRAGKDEVSFNFRGGTLREFIDTLNRRGREKIQASMIAVQKGSKALLLESLITGEDNRLVFSGAMEQLALDSGLLEQAPNARQDIPLNGETITFQHKGEDGSGAVLAGDALTVKAGESAAIAVSSGLQAEGMVLILEIATQEAQTEKAPVPQPPPGPDIPSAGSITYGGITIDNDNAAVSLPPWTPPDPAARVDDMEVISLTFTDGSGVQLPPIEDSAKFQKQQYQLADFTEGKTIASIKVTNNNTHRDVSIRNIQVFDPQAPGDPRPRNAVSTAQDAVLAMDGIEIQRPDNTIADLIPGVTVHLKNPSDKPVKLDVEPDRAAIKDAIIALVGNYNRLMAEVNVLIRNDDRVVQELSYLSDEEQKEFRQRLGTFSGDATLNQFKNRLQRLAASSYPTLAEQDLALLSQIGVGTDIRKAGASSGYDSSRLRGYLEIDEKLLDAALETRLPAVRQLFGNDTDGDLIVDSGIAYGIDVLMKPYVETGGLIALKTGTIDSRITQDGRRIESLERQLLARETSLKNQYAQMEASYDRMEQLSTSIDQFSRRATTNNR
ncbi:MAG: flagellar filament capping protein FliD [Treponema sp.]|jgi:flagellar hook-associated protein 2|nr:flagellar filament capping protein FliD [Treponema sp.]